MGGIDVEDGLERQEKVVDDQDMDHSSEGEDMSDWFLFMPFF